MTDSDRDAARQGRHSDSDLTRVTRYSPDRIAGALWLKLGSTMIPVHRYVTTEARPAGGPRRVRAAEPLAIDLTRKYFNARFDREKATMTKQILIISILVVFGLAIHTSDVELEDHVVVRNLLLRVPTSSFSSLQGQRLVISRRSHEALNPIPVYIVLEGKHCNESNMEVQELLVRIEVDGNNSGLCTGCHCIAKVAPIPDGPHMLAASVYNSKAQILATRILLLYFYTDDDDGGFRDGPELGQAQQILQDYTELHRRILDQDDRTVPKRFLVVSSSHGLANTQIEEVTWHKILLLQPFSVLPRAATRIRAIMANAGLCR